MANESKPVSSKPRRRWLRWLGITFGVLAVLLVAAWFVGTSAWFLKSVILPKVSMAVNATVTVDDADISPFSSVTLRNLKVVTKGDPLLSAQQVRARYGLMDIIKGNINVSEVTIDEPVVNLVTYADGSTSLDPITKNPRKEPAKEPKEKQPKDEKPPQVNLQKFALNNATVRKIDEHKDGTRQVLELTGLTITVGQIGNNQNGKLTLAALVHLDQGLKSASNGVVTAKVNGDFDIALDAALKPKSAKGQTRVDVSEAQGAFAQAAGIGVLLNSDLTPTQLNDVSLRITQAGKDLCALTASGPFDPEKTEGKLNITLSKIDRQVLNIAGAAMGMDFNQTTISSTNVVELTQHGRMVAVNGQLLVGTLSLTQKGQTTPPMDIRAAYAVTCDQTNKTALVQSFSLNGIKQGVEFLRATLGKPMALDFGKGSNAVDESAFDLVITNFNLADWKAFAGTNVDLASGSLNLSLNLQSKQAGKDLTLNFATRLNALTARAGSNRIENADISLDARGTVQNFNNIKLDQYRATLAQAGKQALSASGALAYNTASQDADIQANLDVALPQVAALVKVPGMDIAQGSMTFAGRVLQKNTTPQQTNNPVLDRSVTGAFKLDGFTGAFASNRFDRFVAAADLDVAMRGSDLNIKKFAGTLQQSGQAGGAFDVGGTFNTSNKTGQIAARITDLNQNTLKSFLASALGDKQLESVTINVNTTAKLDGGADGAVKAEMHVANLLVNDPSGSVPHTPLAVDLNADVAMAKQVIDLKSVQLALTKTDRAPNSLNVSGRVDLSKSKAYTGNLKISSDGLDVTPYYELFAKKKDTNAPAATTKPGTATSAPEAHPQQEPPAVKLPIAQFTEELSIAKFYLREVFISNLVSKTTIDNGRVNVNPFSLSLNGAPVTLSALLNLSVPGYEYDVSAKLDRVPVEPLVNTFQPERKGQVKGDLLVGAQVKGAGTTGANLKKNLQGNVGLTLTNGDVKITDNKYVQMLLKPLAAALATPELAESPIRWIDTSIGIGNGSVRLTNFTAETSLLRASFPPGSTLTLNDVLTNSTIDNIPVHLEFRKSLVGRIKFLTENTAGEWLAIPNFYTISGTIGKPDPHIDKTALAKSAVTETLKNVKIGGDAGKILGNFGIGAGAKQPATTNQTATGTNAPAPTNSMQAPLNNLLQGLGGLLDKKQNTNAPARRRNR